MRSSVILLCLALFGFIGLSYQQSTYTRLASSAVKADATAKAALDFGAQIIAEEAVDNRRVKGDDYAVSDIISAKVNGRSYEFEAQISNAKGTNVLEGTYTVYAESATDFILAEYDYQVVQKESFY